MFIKDYVIKCNVVSNAVPSTVIKIDDGLKKAF